MKFTRKELEEKIEELLERVQQIEDEKLEMKTKITMLEGLISQS